MSDLDHLGSAGGNTKTPAENLKKRGILAKRWIFVWNNYPKNWMDHLDHLLEGTKWIVGYEVGEEKETPHLQGYVEFPIRVRPIGYKGAPEKIH